MSYALLIQVVDEAEDMVYDNTVHSFEDEQDALWVAERTAEVAGFVLARLVSDKRQER